MKYYIRAWFGDWKEVSKEKADEFISNYLNSCTCTITEERKKEIIKKHYKEVQE